MKKRIIFAVILCMLLIGGCFEQKNDTKKPEIILNGLGSISLNTNEEFIDEGAIATDDKDGNISHAIKTTIYNDDDEVKKIDTSNTGNYTIKYNVSDNAGNKAEEVTRTISIKNIETSAPLLSQQISGAWTINCNIPAITQYKPVTLSGTVTGNIQKIKIMADQYQIPYNTYINVINGQFKLENYIFSSSGTRKITIIGCDGSNGEITGVRKEYRNIIVASAKRSEVVKIDASVKKKLNRNELLKISGTVTGVTKVFITADDMILIHPKDSYIAVGNGKYEYYRPFDSAGLRKINVWGCDSSGNIIAVSSPLMLTVNDTVGSGDNIQLKLSPENGILTNTLVNISAVFPSSVSAKIKKIKLIADNQFEFKNEAVTANQFNTSYVFNTEGENRILHAYGYDSKNCVVIASPPYFFKVSTAATTNPPIISEGGGALKLPMQNSEYFVGEEVRLKVRNNPNSYYTGVLAYKEADKIYKGGTPYNSFLFPFGYSSQESLTGKMVFNEAGEYYIVARYQDEKWNILETTSYAKIKIKAVINPTVKLISPSHKSVYKKGDAINISAEGVNNHHIAVLMEKTNITPIGNDWLGGAQNGNKYSKNILAEKTGKFRITATGRNTPNENDAGTIKVSSSAIEIEVGIKAKSKYGDMDGNGIISDNDDWIMSLSADGLKALSDDQKKIGDVTGDGKADVADLTQIRRYLLEQITNFAADCTKLEIVSKPTKINYSIGEENVALDGLVVKAYYASGESEIKAITADNISGFDTKTQGTKILTITNGKVSTSFTINVSENKTIRLENGFNGLGLNPYDSHTYNNKTYTYMDLMGEKPELKPWDNNVKVDLLIRIFIKLNAEMSIPDGKMETMYGIKTEAAQKALAALKEYKSAPYYMTKDMWGLLENLIIEFGTITEEHKATVRKLFLEQYKNQYAVMLANTTPKITFINPKNIKNEKTAMNENVIINVEVNNSDNATLRIVKPDKTKETKKLTAKGNCMYEVDYTFDQTGTYVLSVDSKNTYSGIARSNSCTVTAENKNNDGFGILDDNSKWNKKNGYYYTSCGSLRIIKTKGNNIGILATPEGMITGKYSGYETAVNGSFFGMGQDVVDGEIEDSGKVISAFKGLLGEIGIMEQRGHPLYAISAVDDIPIYKDIYPANVDGHINDHVGDTLVYDSGTDTFSVQHISSIHDIKLTNKSSRKYWAIGGRQAGDDEIDEYKNKYLNAYNENLTFSENMTFYLYDKNNNFYIIVLEKGNIQGFANTAVGLKDAINKFEKEYGIKIENGVISDGGSSSIMRVEGKNVVDVSDEALVKRIPSMLYVKSDVSKGYWSVFIYQDSDGNPHVEASSIYRSSAEIPYNSQTTNRVGILKFYHDGVLYEQRRTGYWAEFKYKDMNGIEHTEASNIYFTDLQLSSLYPGNDFKSLKKTGITGIMRFYHDEEVYDERNITFK